MTEPQAHLDACKQQAIDRILQGHGFDQSLCGFYRGLLLNPETAVLAQSVRDCTSKLLVAGEFESQRDIIEHIGGYALASNRGEIMSSDNGGPIRVTVIKLANSVSRETWQVLFNYYRDCGGDLCNLRDLLVDYDTIRDMVRYMGQGQHVKFLWCFDLDGTSMISSQFHTAAIQSLSGSFDVVVSCQLCLDRIETELLKSPPRDPRTEGQDAS